MRKWPAIGLVLLLAIGLAWWNEQNIRIWASFELSRRTPLPDFDAGKAAGLSAERRAALERELFGEVHMWNTQSRSYHGPNGGIEREMRWQAMADDGYELAHLALKVFEPSTGHMHNPIPALERLDELARKDDSGAMCLFASMVIHLPDRGGIDWSPYHKLKNAWMKRGADMGHPQCLIALGGRLMAGSDGQPLNVQHGMNMIFGAIKKGYTHGVGSLSLLSERRGLDKAGNRREMYCWDYQASQYSYHDPDLTLRVYMQSEAPTEQREGLLRELGQLRRWRPALEECIELTRLNQGE